jgi:hypothetical protein
MILMDTWPNIASGFALAKRQMEEHGATAEDFARVSKNHHHGCLNPVAQHQRNLQLRY